MLDFLCNLNFSLLPGVIICFPMALFYGVMLEETAADRDFLGMAVALLMIVTCLFLGGYSLYLFLGGG